MASERAGAAAGIVGPLVALTSIAVAIAGSSTFAWTGSALSDLGSPGTATAPVFNGGLLAGGLLAVPFALVLQRASRGSLRRAGAVLLGLSGLALVGIGLFPVGDPLHYPSSVAFFGLASLVPWTYGLGDYRAGAVRAGAFGLALGALNVVGWVAWAALAGAVGIAVPEAVGALAFGSWTVATAARQFVAGGGRGG